MEETKKEEIQETKGRQGDSPLFWAKLQTGLLAGILAVLLVFTGVTVGIVSKTLNRLDMDRVNEALAAVQTVASELEALDLENVNDTVTALGTAADALTKADMNAVNDAIASLSAAADQLGELDMEELNGLIDSLKSAAEQLDTVTGGLAKIFKR